MNIKVYEVIKGQINSDNKIQPNNRGLKVLYLPMARTATILTTLLGGSHSETKASTAYLEKLRQMMASCDGFSTNVETQENR